MITASEFRNGITFEFDNQVFQIIEFQHVKPGKGAAFVRTKIKNMFSGAVVDKTFNPSDKIKIAYIERCEMQYLYNEGDLYYFMNNKNYEQISIEKNKLPENFNLIKENEICKINLYKNKIFNIELPKFVISKIISTEPNFKGNSTNNAFKNAIIENNIEIKVPMFIEKNDLIKIDTAKIIYMERVK